MATLLSCPRAHYWAYEVGLRRTEDEDSKSLRIGSAWHRAMEKRWLGGTYEQALEAALGNDDSIPAIETATIAGLLIGYYSKWGEVEKRGRILPEKEFNFPLIGSRTFRVAGKIDCLGEIDRITKLVESKTTGTSIDSDSDYWLRLRFNSQIFQYVLAARALGFDPAEVVYDVTRKPAIEPKLINDLDSEGLKIVVDLATGERAKLKNGDWRQSGGEGFEVKQHRESADEFGERLAKDTLDRPDFYFARREVPILEDELAAFQEQRLTLSRMILHCRSSEKQMSRPENAWPRNVSVGLCNFCQYKNFCLQNISIDIKHPPSGFAVGRFNPELSERTDSLATTNEE
jgi:hypothetical protein